MEEINTNTNERIKFLVCVDMQVDFISGQLPNPAAAEIIPVISEKLKNATEQRIPIVFTMDTHDENYMETMEGKKLPVPHCEYDTEGWEIIPELKDYKGLRVVKNTFGSFEVQSFIRRTGGSLGAETDADLEIEICGTVTSICVIANAIILRAAFPNATIIVDAKAVADISPEAQTAALAVMKSQQIDVINE